MMLYRSIEVGKYRIDVLFVLPLAFILFPGVLSPVHQILLSVLLLYHSPFSVFVTGLSAKELHFPEMVRSHGQLL